MSDQQNFPKTYKAAQIQEKGGVRAHASSVHVPPSRSDDFSPVSLLVEIQTRRCRMEEP